MLKQTVVVLLVLCTILTRGVVATPFRNLKQGLNYAPCVTNKDCYGDRECYNINGEEGDKNCKEETVDCVCVPKQFEQCEQDSDCTFGEQCVYDEYNPVHCTTLVGYAPDEDSIFKDSCSDSNEPLPTSEPSRAPNLRQGLVRQDEEVENNHLTYDSCTQTSECQDDRQCLDVNEFDCCAGGACMCIPPKLQFCKEDDDCGNPEEECLRTSVDPPRCVSRTAADNFDGRPLLDGGSSGLGVCIAAVHLQNVIPNESLVFKRHVPARVLCDQFDSCATPGHMVVYHHVPMTMSSYCQRIGSRCTVRQMTVNSPVYRRKLRIPSRTPSLSFTTFAASYESRFEETFLRTIIRFGL